MVRVQPSCLMELVTVWLDRRQIDSTFNTLIILYEAVAICN